MKDAAVFSAGVALLTGLYLIEEHLPLNDSGAHKLSFQEVAMLKFPTPNTDKCCLSGYAWLDRAGVAGTAGGEAFYETRYRVLESPTNKGPHILVHFFHGPGVSRRDDGWIQAVFYPSRVQVENGTVVIYATDLKVRRAKD